MTASTRTVTLSRVMPSRGTGNVMIVFTFCRRSTIGTHVRPVRERGSDAPEPVHDASFELLDDPDVLQCQPEHADSGGAGRGECVEDGHGVLLDGPTRGVVLAPRGL
jgi:hypothetical protein